MEAQCCDFSFLSPTRVPSMVERFSMLPEPSLPPGDSVMLYVREDL